MAKKSRSKRRSVRAARHTTNSRWWYALIGAIVVAGVLMVAVSRPHPSTVGPQPGKDHWHAALGVYDCDHWLGDSTGKGIWNWPAATAQGSPSRVGTNEYAGLHSHDDGIIHMEPATEDESGDNATVGRYFDFGGWQLSTSGFSFLGTTAQNSDKCAGKPSALRWATAKFNGNPNAAQSYTEHHGDPAKFKLNDGDVVVIAFMPTSKSFATVGNPPSLKNLPGAEGREGQGSPATMPTIPATTKP